MSSLQRVAEPAPACRLSGGSEQEVRADLGVEQAHGGGPRRGRGLVDALLAAIKGEEAEAQDGY